MVLPPFPRGCKHDFRFAGLLTYSGRFRLPTRQRFSGSGKRGWKRLFGELTAAGLSGTFTRFPFHPQIRVGTWSEQNCRKDMNYFFRRKQKRIFFSWKSGLMFFSREQTYILSFDSSS